MLRCMCRGRDGCIICSNNNSQIEQSSVSTLFHYIDEVQKNRISLGSKKSTYLTVGDKSKQSDEGETVAKLLYQTKAKKRISTHYKNNENDMETVI